MAVDESTLLISLGIAGILAYVMTREDKRREKRHPWGDMPDRYSDLATERDDKLDKKRAGQFIEEQVALQDLDEFANSLDGPVQRFRLKMFKLFEEIERTTQTPGWHLPLSQSYTNRLAKALEEVADLQNTYETKAARAALENNRPQDFYLNQNAYEALKYFREVAFRMQNANEQEILGILRRAAEQRNEIQIHNNYLQQQANVWQDNRSWDMQETNYVDQRTQNNMAMLVRNEGQPFNSSPDPMGLEQDYSDPPAATNLLPAPQNNDETQLYLDNIRNEATQMDSDRYRALPAPAEIPGPVRKKAKHAPDGFDSSPPELRVGQKRTAEDVEDYPDVEAREVAKVKSPDFPEFSAAPRPDKNLASYIPENMTQPDDRFLQKGSGGKQDLPDDPRDQDQAYYDRLNIAIGQFTMTAQEGATESEVGQAFYKMFMTVPSKEDNINIMNLQFAFSPDEWRDVFQNRDNKRIDEGGLREHIRTHDTYKHWKRNVKNGIALMKKKYGNVKSLDAYRVMGEEV